MPTYLDLMTELRNLAKKRELKQEKEERMRQRILDQVLMSSKEEVMIMQVFKRPIIYKNRQ